MDPSLSEVQIKAETVIAVYKQRVADLEEQMIMLQAAVRQMQEGDKTESE